MSRILPQWIGYIKHKDNSNLINQILQLKQEKAKLLGKSNFAELSLASKMATFDQAMALLTQLRDLKRLIADRRSKCLHLYLAPGPPDKCRHNCNVIPSCEHRRKKPCFCSTVFGLDFEPNHLEHGALKCGEDGSHIAANV